MVGRREALWRGVYEQAGGSPAASRATVYARMRALPLLGELHRRGLIADLGGRDVQTGRKVASIVLEVARLGPREPSEAELDELVSIYLHVRNDPLAKVRQVLRQVRASE